MVTTTSYDSHVKNKYKTTKPKQQFLIIERMHALRRDHACMRGRGRDLSCLLFFVGDHTRANSIVSPGLVMAHEAGRDALAAEVEDEAEVDGKVDVDA